MGTQRQRILALCGLVLVVSGPACHELSPYRSRFAPAPDSQVPLDARTGPEDARLADGIDIDASAPAPSLTCEDPTPVGDQAGLSLHEPALMPDGLVIVAAVAQGPGLSHLTRDTPYEPFTGAWKPWGQAIEGLRDLSPYVAASSEVRLLAAESIKPRKIRDSDLLGKGEDLRIAFDHFPDTNAVVDLDGPSALIEGSGGLTSFLFNAVDWGASSSVPGGPDLFVAVRGPGDLWSARPLEEINTQHHEGDPAIGLGGRLIVFESNRPSLSGATIQTLWYSTRRDTTARFSAPREVRSLRSAEPAIWAPPGATSGAVQLYFQQDAEATNAIMWSTCRFEATTS